VRDVEIIGLRADCCGPCSERALSIRFAARHQVKIIADADDLDDAVECCFEVFDDGRRKFDCPLLARDVRRLGIADKPIPVAIDPDIQPMIANESGRSPCRIGGKDMLMGAGSAVAWGSAASERGMTTAGYSEPWLLRIVVA